MPENSSINNIGIKPIKQPYEPATSRIKIRNKASDSFLVTKGLRQGCCPSSTLFKIYLNEALKRWRRVCIGMGIQLDEEKTLYTLHFGDEQVVIAQDEGDLEFMTNRLIKEYEKWGLLVKKTKTKYLCIGQEPENIRLNDNEFIQA